MRLYYRSPDNTHWCRGPMDYMYDERLTPFILMMPFMDRVDQLVVYNRNTQMDLFGTTAMTPTEFSYWVANNA